MDSSLWSKEILIYNTVSQQSSLLGKIMQNNRDFKNGNIKASSWKSHAWEHAIFLCS